MNAGSSTLWIIDILQALQHVGLSEESKGELTRRAFKTCAGILPASVLHGWHQLKKEHSFAHICLLSEGELRNVETRALFIFLAWPCCRSPAREAGSERSDISLGCHGSLVNSCEAASGRLVPKEVTCHCVWPTKGPSISANVLTATRPEIIS